MSGNNGFHNEITELQKCLDTIKLNITNLRVEVHQMNSRVRKQFYDTGNGISFLGMKYQLLLNYCTNLLFFLLLKSKGKSVRGHPVIKNLVEQRVILEHMKPISSKLQSTIRKLVLISSRSLENVIDVPFDNTMNDESGEEEEENGSNKEINYNQIEPPPSLAASTKDPRFDTTDFIDEEIPSSGEEMEEDDEIVGPPVPLDPSEVARREKERKKLSDRLVRSQLWKEIQNIEEGRPIERPIVGSESFMEFEDEEEDDDVFEEMGIKGNKRTRKQQSQNKSATGDFDRELEVLNRTMMDMKRANRAIEEDKNPNKSRRGGFSIDLDEDGDDNEMLAMFHKQNSKSNNVNKQGRGGGGDVNFGFGYDDDEEVVNDNKDDNDGPKGRKRSRKRKKRNFRNKKGRSRKRRRF